MNRMRHAWRLGVAVLLAAVAVSATAISRSEPSDQRMLSGAPPARDAEFLRVDDPRKPDFPSVPRAPVVPEAQAASFFGGPWTTRGPRPIVPSYGGSAGRVTSIAVDPTSQGSTVYIGTVGGGVWKSTDAGGTWAPTSDFEASLSIGALAIDPSGQVIYAGTGEYNYGSSQYGQGILKSTDAGATWTLLGQATFGGRHIGGIAIDRTTSGATQRVFAATNAGLYMSFDGGVTWTLNTSLRDDAAVPYFGTPSGSTYEVFQDPSEPATFWASVGDFCGTEYGNIAQSTDGGVTWTNVLVFDAPVSVPALGVGPGGVAYAAPAGCNGALVNDEIQATTDGGATWTPMPVPHIFSANYLRFQGWYDNVVAVDPTNASHAVFGGVYLLATDDGGNSFTHVGGPLHVDFHAAAFTGTPDTLYAGNDGGVWRTSNLGGTGTPSDWTNLNNTLTLTEYYYGSSDDVTTPRLLGGTQDNGSPGNFGPSVGDPPLPQWFHYWGGDGAFTAIDPNAASNTVYVEFQYINMWRLNVSTNAASPASPCDTFDVNSQCVRGGVPDRTPFIAPFVMDPANSQVLFAGTHRIYRTTNGGVPAGSASWSPVGPADATTGGGDYLAMMTAGRATTTGTPLVVLTGSQRGAVWRSIDGGNTWNNITGNLPLASGGGYVFPNPFVSGIAFNPANPSEVWVSNGGVGRGHIFHTLNAHTASPTWTALDGSGAGAIPDAPAYAVMVDPDMPRRLYVGTYYGARVCDQCGGTSPKPSWEVLGSGLPNSPVGWLSLTRDENTLVAWTKGRGAWTMARPGPTAVQVASFTARPTEAGIVVSWKTGRDASIAGFNVVRDGSRLNRQLIRVKRAGQASGAVYRYVDRTARGGSVHTYRLQVVDLSGKRRWHPTAARLEVR